MKDPMSLPQRPSMPPVGADVLGRPQPGPPRTSAPTSDYRKPWPPATAPQRDFVYCGCGPPRTSAPTDSLTFHSCATTKRIGRNLRVAMPPAGSTPTHDSIAEPQALHFSRVMRPRRRRRVARGEAEPRSGRKRPRDSASRWVFVYQREAPRLMPPLPGT